jgi:hypothetical protein
MQNFAIRVELAPDERVDPGRRRRSSDRPVARVVVKIRLGPDEGLLVLRPEDQDLRGSQRLTRGNPPPVR